MNIISHFDRLSTPPLLHQISYSATRLSSTLKQLIEHQNSIKLGFQVVIVNEKGTDQTVLTGTSNIESVLSNSILKKKPGSSGRLCVNMNEVIEHCFREKYKQISRIQNSNQDLYDELRKKTETEFDKTSNHFLNDDVFCACDTRKDNPYFQALEDSEDQEGVASGISDISSVLGPIIKIEYKSKLFGNDPITTKEPENVSTTDVEIHVLVQAIRRVMFYGRINETLKRSIGFATTGVFSWVVLLQRERINYKLVEKLYLINIHNHELLPLYDWCNYRALNDPFFTFFDDWYVVKDLLSACKIEPTLCGIKDCFDMKHFAVSESRFYKIYLPRYNSIQNQVRTTTVDISDEDDCELVVKINLNERRGQHEVKVINHIHECWTKTTSSTIPCSPVKYVLATLSESRVTSLYDYSDMVHFIDYHKYQTDEKGDAVLVKNIAFDDPNIGWRKIDAEVEKASSECPPYLTPSAFNLVRQKKAWWQTSCQSLQSSEIKKFNGILMVRGYPSQMVDERQLQNSLQWIHQTAHILHTDLRPTNMVKFPCIPSLIPNGQTSFVIDFDLAHMMVNPVHPSRYTCTLKLGNGARKECIVRMGFNTGEDTAEWSSFKDLTMLVVATMDRKTLISQNTNIRHFNDSNTPPASDSIISSNTSRSTDNIQSLTSKVLALSVETTSQDDGSALFGKKKNSSSKSTSSAAKHGHSAGQI